MGHQSRIAAARDHSIKCANWSGGYGLTNRHHLLRDAIAGVLQSTGATVSCEFQIGENRMDLVVSSTEGQHYWLDVGVTSEAPGTMYATKMRTYTALAEQHDAEFHPLIFNTQAEPHAACKKTLQKLVCDFGVPLPRLMSAVVGAIVCGNGLTVSKAEAHVRASLGRRPAQTAAHKPPQTTKAAPQQQQQPQPMPKAAKAPPPTPRKEGACAQRVVSGAGSDVELAWALRPANPTNTTKLSTESGAAAGIRAELAQPLSAAAPAASTATFGQAPAKQQEAKAADKAAAAVVEKTGGGGNTSLPAAAVRPTPCPS